MTTKFPVAASLISICLAGCATAPSSSIATNSSHQVRLPSNTTESDVDHVDTFTYNNARYGFSISYISAFFQQGSESDDNSGTTAQSLDGHATLRAFGSWDMSTPILPLSEAYKAAAAAIKQDATKTLTYQTINVKGGFYVLSGYKNNGAQIYYVKTYVTDGAEKTFELDYDASKKSIYDGLIASIADSFVTFAPAK